MHARGVRAGRGQVHERGTPEARAADAIADLLELVHLLKSEAFDDFGIVLTRVDTRKSRTNAAVFAALGPWNEKILGTVIPQSEPLNQAQMERKGILLFDPASASAVAYRELINELQNLSCRSGFS